MAITPLSSDVKKLTFDGETSASYGVRILGTGVFNAPQRATRAITVPGRNGSVMMDLGRFENIDVTYPANLVADNPEDFAAAMSEFRNFLCSKKGYCRLEDDYNPGEYRLAMYKGGLEVSEKVLKAGEFNITFTCKPQRFLTSGETEVTVASGGTITNPTPFDSQPLLAVKGEGTVTVNGYAIRLIHQDLGDVTLSGAVSGDIVPPNAGVTRSVLSDTFNPNLLNQGDEVTIRGAKVSLSFSSKSRLVSVTNETGITGVTFTKGSSMVGFVFPDITVGFDDSSTEKTYSCTVNVKDRITETRYQYTLNLRFGCVHYGTSGTARIYINIGRPSTDPEFLQTIPWRMLSVTAYSTANALGDPTYIDCEIGEAYMLNDGSYVSLNSNIDLGSDVPTLAPGANRIIYDNTITEVKITPRWWKI